MEASDRTGGIKEALQSQIALNRLAVKGAMQCLNWLVKSEIPILLTTIVLSRLLSSWAAITSQG